MNQNLERKVIDANGNIYKILDTKNSYKLIDVITKEICCYDFDWLGRMRIYFSSNYERGIDFTFAEIKKNKQNKTSNNNFIKIFF